jgi:hypothetical protein
MAIADPQTLTINAVAVPLPRTASGQDTGSFTSADGLVKLSVASNYGKRTRRTVRVDHRKVAADPFVTGVNQEYSLSAYVVFDVPKVGYSVVEQKQIIDALMAWLTASTGAKITQVLGGES